MSKWGEMKWGDQDGEDDDEKSMSTRAPQQVSFSSAPDKDGVKTITEFRTEDGKKIKVIRKVKETKTAVRVNKNILSRRKWKKFGDCKNAPPGIEENITYSSHENIRLQLKPRKREEEEEEDDDPLSKLKMTDSIVVCRHCGEQGHWTLKCPKRGEIIVQEKSRPNESGGTSSSGDSRMSATTTTNTSGKYVPVHLRAGNAGMTGSGGRDREEEQYTIRVTNISEDTTEDDLRALFRRFGHTTRIYLAKDRQTGISRGFAFISYKDKSDAQEAISTLNGHGYDNLILHLEFAKPREEGGGGGGGGAPSAGSQGAGSAGWTMRGTR